MFFVVQIVLVLTLEATLICVSYNPHKSNISNHLHHLGKGPDNYIGNNDNILLLRDFNSEFPEPCLNDFCDI